MTVEQILTLVQYFSDQPDIEFHHGDCVGADDQAAFLASCFNSWIVSHPPSDPKLRAHRYSNVTVDEKPYLERDRDIVDACDYLLAAPKQDRNGNHDPRSGTWYTIRYAMWQNRPVTIIWPDGSTERRNAREPLK